MKFHSKSVEEHGEAPLPDAGRWEALVEHWTERETPPVHDPNQPNACYVVSLFARGSDADPEAQLAEMVGLVEAQGDRVVGQVAHDLVRPDPKTLLRKGVAERLAEAARAVGANLLVLDAELSPSQARNLEDATGLSVSDREAVILNVFERNATTRRARMQVEIAHLQYLRPRIRGIGLDMDQQAGGILGGRGPGETASELLARKLDGRVAQLKANLLELKRGDRTQRKHRRETARIVLLGYTNAGKTSLMNALSQTKLSARSRPFETLDTTSRCLTRHGTEVLLSDTVGFIRRLPERLLASFESTLAEVQEASLLVLVVDVSDREYPLHLRTTHEVLGRLEAMDVPRFYVFNKCDRVGTLPHEADLLKLTEGQPYMAVSAHDTARVAQLRQVLLNRARQHLAREQVFVPYTASETLQRVYAECRVIAAEAEPLGMRFTLEGEPHVVSRLRRRAEELGA